MQRIYFVFPTRRKQVSVSTLFGCWHHISCWLCGFLQTFLASSVIFTYALFMWVACTCGLFLGTVEINRQRGWQSRNRALLLGAQSTSTELRRIISHKVFHIQMGIMKVVISSWKPLAPQSNCYIKCNTFRNPSLKTLFMQRRLLVAWALYFILIWNNVTSIMCLESDYYIFIRGWPASTWQAPPEQGLPAFNWTFVQNLILYIQAWRS